MSALATVLVGIALVGGGERPPMGPSVPTQELASLAEQVRRAWAGQRAAGVIGQSARVQFQLPGQGAGASVGRDQAVRLLEGLFRRSEEVEVRVVSSRQVGPGQGYVELRRRYRLSGTDEERTQRVLLAFRSGPDGGRWGLVELRVVEGDG